jgi:hypothetical protein|tara:strand:+ start:1745 stop:3460 length:1716 start_codon:yes stop_codon:yes gene_type:complete
MDKLHCYIRVSGRSQLKEGESIQTQIDIGKRISKELGLQYEEVLEGKDGVASSTTGTRREFEQLKKDILKGKVTNIWFLEFSRFSRGGVKGQTGFGIEGMDFIYSWCVPYAINVFEGMGAEKIEVDTKMGRWSLFMKSEGAMDEGLIIGERTSRGKSVQGKRFQGKNKFMGGTVIYGYKNIDKTFQLDKQESDLVKELFKRYSKGDSITDIGRSFDERGIKPRRAKYWNTATLINMLNNEHYLGTYRWFDNYSKSHITHTIPQIIKHSLFNKVKKQLECNYETKGDNRRKVISLLGDILWCGDCNNRITQLIKHENHPSRPISKVYNCNVGMMRYKKRETISCENKRSLNMDSTDAFVIKTVKEVILNSHLLKQRVKEELMDSKGDKVQKSTNQTKILEKSIKNIDKKIESLEIAIANVKTKIILGEEKENVGNMIIKNLEQGVEELSNSKQTHINDITRLDDERDWIDWVFRYGEKLEISMEESPKAVIKEHLSRILVEPFYTSNRDGFKTQQGHKLKLYFKLPIVGDSIVYHNEKEKSEGYSLENGRKVFNTVKIPTSKGGRPAIKKKA